MRWYQRLLDIYSGKIEEHPEMAVDEMTVFFIFCYQLKDWIIKDTAIPKKEVEDFVTQTQCLAICADIANSINHLGIDENKSPRSGKDVRMRPAFAIIKDKTVVPRPIITSGNGTTIDVKDLATECVKEWNGFLKAHSY
jgi:hypothetical protein